MLHDVATETDVSLGSMLAETKKSPGEIANTLSCLSLSGTSCISSLEHLWKLLVFSDSLQTGNDVKAWLLTKVITEHQEAHLSLSLSGHA